METKESHPARHRRRERHTQSCQDQEPDCAIIPRKCIRGSEGHGFDALIHQPDAATNNTLSYLRSLSAAALQRSGRCPRCGYVLRFDGKEYRCDFCGYQRRQGLTNALQGVERNLKIKVHGLREMMRQGPSRQVYVYYPVAVRPCLACGVNLPLGTARCPNCGTSQETPQPPSSSQRIAMPRQGFEKAVLDYVIAHNGTISLSQAAQELRLPQDALQSILERLQEAGFINQV